MASLNAVLRASRRSSSQRRRQPVLLMATEFPAPGPTELFLANFHPEVGPAYGGASFIRPPYSVGSLKLGGTDPRRQNQVYNSSGSEVSYGYYAEPLPSTNCTIEGEMQVTSLGTGNTCEALMRMSETLETFYTVRLQSLSAGFLNISLQKRNAGAGGGLNVSRNLAPVEEVSPGDIWEFRFRCANDAKILYVRGPNPEPDDQWIRVGASGDNTIPSAGFAGVGMLRSAWNGGIHMKSLRLYVNGPQEPSGVTQAPTPDPVQAPQLLWTPNYAEPGPSVPWYRVQKPRKGGVIVSDSMEIVAQANLPGQGQPYCPPTPAMRVRLRPFSSPEENFEVTLLAPLASSDTAIVVSAADAALLGDRMFLNAPDADVMRVQGAPPYTDLGGGLFSVPIQRDSSPTAHSIGEVLKVPMGDVNDSGSMYQTSRAEVYDRFSTSGGSAPPSSWPDPVGSIRWYGVSFFFPTATFPLTGGGSNPWLTLTQWKQQYGGSPKRAIEVDTDSGGHLKLGGTNTHLGLGPLNRGTWTRLVIGFRWDITAINAWLTAYRDGALKIARRYEATMDRKGAGADPQYLKEGIYRTKGWTVTHEVFIGPIKVGTTMADVWDA